MFFDIWIEHDDSIFRRKTVCFNRAISFVYFYNMALAIGFGVFAPNTTRKVIFISKCFFCFIFFHSICALFCLRLGY